MAHGYAQHGRNHTKGGSDPIPGIDALGVGDWVTPTLINSWSNAGAPFDDIAYRHNGPNLEFKGHITGGTSGTIAFYLDSAYWPTTDLSTITDVVTIGTPEVAQIYVRASDGAVIVTSIP